MSMETGLNTPQDTPVFASLTVPELLEALEQKDHIIHEQKKELTTTIDALWEIYKSAEGGSFEWRHSLGVLIELGKIDPETFERIK